MNLPVCEVGGLNLSRVALVNSLQLRVLGNLKLARRIIESIWTTHDLGCIAHYGKAVKQ
jgi:hypothetical protein